MALFKKILAKISKTKRDKELSVLIQSKTFFLAANKRPKMQSKILDHLLFPNKEKIEKELAKHNPLFSEHLYSDDKKYEDSQVWIGLHPQNLETPYLEFLRLFEFLKQNNFQIDSVIDIGSAYGRAGVVLQAVYPHAFFTGYEIVPERAAESNKTFERLGIQNAKSICTNVKKETLPLANLYIIYDFSHLEDIYFLIESLIQKNTNEKFLIAARGDQAPRIIQRSFKDLFVVAAPIHSSRWSLYSSYNW